MGGTKAGGKKAAATNKFKYGDSFYRRIGRRGGKMGHTGGFYANPELAKEAGRKGGLISSRKGIKNGQSKYNKVVDDLIPDEEIDDELLFRKASERQMLMNEIRKLEEDW